MPLCSGGNKRIQGVKYGLKEPTVLPRLKWQAACESAQTAAELALQIRELDNELNWNALKPPPNTDPASNAILLGKQKSTLSYGHDYLVLVPGASQVKQLRPENTYMTELRGMMKTT